MRKIKNSKKKIKDDLIKVPDNIINKSMELLKKMCKDEDTYKFLEIILDLKTLEQDIFMFSFKHTLFGMEYMADRNERFRAQKVIEEGIPVLVERYKPLLEPSTDLEIATILFDINELLTKYANIPNKIFTDIQKAKTEKAQKFVKCLSDLKRGFKGNIVEVLGEDPCVEGNFKKKFLEVTNWITNAFYNRINCNNINELFSYDVLNVSIESKIIQVTEVTNNEIGYSTWAFENWKNLCYYINELTARTSLVELAYPKLQEKGIDKKELSHLKSTITRTNKLIENLYNLLNFGEDIPTDETMEEVKEVYGMLPVDQLKKVVEVEKLIA